eukprot:COSAG01_NODE_19856_length_985_cov_1.419865_1_plen_91_part_10
MGPAVLPVLPRLATQAPATTCSAPRSPCESGARNNNLMRGHVLSCEQEGRKRLEALQASIVERLRAQLGPQGTTSSSALRTVARCTGARWS